jgi:DNA repair exonuclease SbcCD ATPase subunit
MTPRTTPAPQSAALKPVLDLEELLGEMLVEHRKLLGHVESQLTAMKQMKIRQMEAARNLQEASRSRINALENRRRILVQQIARMNQLQSQPKIPQLAEMFPSRKAQLLKLRAELETVMKEIQSRSHVASRLASAVLGHLNTAMRILAGAVGGAGVYTNRGVPRVSRRIGMMETVG